MRMETVAHAEFLRVRRMIIPLELSSGSAAELKRASDQGNKNYEPFQTMARRLAAAFLAVASARFADSTGDERFTSHIGPVIAASSAGAKNVIVSTAANVVADLNIRSGEVAWRVALDERIVGSALRSADAVTLSSSDRSTLVRKWLPGAKGGLAWEKHVGDGALDASAAAGGQLVALNDAAVGVIVDGSLQLYGSKSGSSLEVAGLSALNRVIAVAASAAAAGAHLFAIAVPSGSDSGADSASLLRIAVPTGGATSASSSVVEAASYAVKTDKPRINVSRMLLVPAYSGADAAVLASSPSGAHLHFFSSAGGSKGSKRFSVKQLLEPVAPGLAGTAAAALPTIVAISPVSDASTAASGGAGSPFVRLALSDGSELLLAVTFKSGGVAEAEVGATGDVSTGAGAGSASSCTLTPLHFASGAPSSGALPPHVGPRVGRVFTSVTSGGASHLLEVTTSLAGSVSTSLLTVVSDSAGVVSEKDGAAALASVAKVTLPGPLTANEFTSLSSGGVVSLGPVTAAFALPPSGKVADAPLRLLLTSTSGHVLSTQAATAGGQKGASSGSSTTKVSWAKPEGDACVTQVLSVDVPRKGTPGYSSSGAGSTSASTDPALSFPSRFASQLAELSTALPSAMSWVASTITHAASGGVGRLLELSGMAKTLQPSNSITPGLSIGGLEKLLVLRTRLDGGEIGSCDVSGGHTDVNGVLKGLEFESGLERWSLLLPLSSAVREAVASNSSAKVKTVAMLSRPRPIQAHSAEVMLVESVSEVTSESVTSVVTGITWVNAHTGAVTASVAYTSSSALHRVVRTPLLHSGSHREVYALLHKDGSGVAAPGGADVSAALAHVRSDFVSVDLRVDDATGAESVVGLLLTPAAAAPVAAVVPHPGLTSVPLLSVSSSQLWSVGVAFGAAANGAALERVLAMTASGGSSGGVSGAVLSTELLASAAGSKKSSSSGAAKKAEKLIQEAMAASAAEGGEAAGAGGRPVQILGDDSLLLKYVNPHLVAVVVGAPGPTAGSWEKKNGRAYPGNASSFIGGAGSSLALFLIDGVTGRVVHNRKHASATGPCAILKHDNWVLYSYWNARARRPEIASAALYEGLIEANQLAPWRKPPGWEAYTRDDVSSWGQEPPLVVHRSFILPVTATDISVTRTRYGITTPHLLLTTSQDGLLSLDRRILDPRRPTNETSKHEQAEGLIQYSPVLPLRHSWLLTGGRPVQGAHLTHSAPSAFESTTLIALLGVDHFFIRTAPARTFDQLGADFNSLLFVAVVTMGAVGTLVLRSMVKKRDLQRAWK